MDCQEPVEAVLNAGVFRIAPGRVPDQMKVNGIAAFDPFLPQHSELRPGDPRPPAPHNHQAAARSIRVRRAPNHNVSAQARHLGAFVHAVNGTAPVRESQGGVQGKTLAPHSANNAGLGLMRIKVAGGEHHLIAGLPRERLGKGDLRRPRLCRFGKSCPAWAGNHAVEIESSAQDRQHFRFGSPVLRQRNHGAVGKRPGRAADHEPSSDDDRVGFQGKIALGEYERTVDFKALQGWRAGIQHHCLSDRDVHLRARTRRSTVPDSRVRPELSRALRGAGKEPPGAECKQAS